jgi:uncharacterized protein YkwD
MLGLRSAVGIAFALATLVHTGARAAGADTAEAAKHIFERTNELRAAQGLQPLGTSGELAAAANGFARYMAETGSYGHRADARQPVERATREGYDYCIVSENIARLYRSAGYDAQGLAVDMVEGWKQSHEHRRAMLDRAVTQTGVGVAQDEKGRYYGVQMFGRPKTGAIQFSLSNQSGRTVEYAAGERRFSLAPRTERTHTVCRPMKITVALPKPFSASAQSGARYVVLERGGALEVQTTAAR